jgi:electron transport complex protein RnfE
MAQQKQQAPEEEKIELLPRSFKDKMKKVSAKVKDYYSEFSKGIFKLNPTFVILLGLCPTLAVTTSIDNAIGMGFAAMFVLLFSEIFISAIRKIVPSNVRMPVYIVVIATSVTITGLIIKAYSPALDKSLGIYIPLIVVNCIIFARAESFSSKNTVFRSILDAVGIGIGFTLALILISGIREIIGTGKLALFGHTLFSATAFYNPMLIFILAPGALLTMGLLLAFFNWWGSLDIKKQASHIESHNPDNLKGDEPKEEVKQEVPPIKSG